MHSETIDISYTETIRRRTLSATTHNLKMGMGQQRRPDPKRAAEEHAYHPGGEGVRPSSSWVGYTRMPCLSPANPCSRGRDNLNNLMNAKRIGAYVGVDPTAASIHVGHMVPFMALFWMYLHGYETISLIGGATARVGDPTGRTTQREKIDSIDRKANVTHMHLQLKGIWMHVEELGRKYGYHAHRSWKRAVLNNNVWLNKATVPEILMLMGGGLRMGSLMSRDSVKSRMESQEGMSFSEFCYPLLQAWDWWHMYQSRSIQLQIGGADQFGNIITGIEGVKHVARTHPHNDVRVPEEEQNWEPMGFTVPLMTTSSGEKFGKSAGNAVWLNLEMTSAFDLYAVSTCPHFKRVQLTCITVHALYFRCRRRTISQTLHIHATRRNLQSSSGTRHTTRKTDSSTLTRIRISQSCTWA